MRYASTLALLERIDDLLVSPLGPTSASPDHA